MKSLTSNYSGWISLQGSVSLVWQAAHSHDSSPEAASLSHPPALKEVEPGPCLNKRTWQIWVTVLLTVSSFGWGRKRVPFAADNPIAVVKWWSNSLCVLAKFQWRWLPLHCVKILGISIWCAFTPCLAIPVVGENLAYRGQRHLWKWGY